MPQSPAEALAAFSPGLPVAVALSGGADSTALLIACAERWPGQVRAVHVHHGLQSAADDFEAFCRQLCAQLQVPLCVQRVDARAAPGQSPEDAARQARYAALAEAVHSHWPEVHDVALARRGTRIDALHHQRHLQLRAQLAAKGFKVVGRALQAMVHMHRPHLAGPALGASDQQGGGVGAAREGHRQRQAGAETGQGLGRGLRHTVGAYLPALVSLKRP